MSNHIVLALKNGVRRITINRPEAKNAINRDMYQKINDTLNNDAENNEIVVTIITGTGDYYSSGNDVKSSLAAMSDPDEQFHLVERMIEAFINYPKLLIAVVNGPAIGIAATSAALCDIVYASDKAVFDTPFLRMGLCVEGGSSYTFPTILGRSIASEVVFLNRKLTAQEAVQYGMVSKVIPHNEIETFIEELSRYGNLSVDNVKRNKALIVSNFKKLLTESNRRETEGLKECIQSDDFINAAMAFITKKNKL